MNFIDDSVRPSVKQGWIPSGANAFQAVKRFAAIRRVYRKAGEELDGLQPITIIMPELSTMGFMTGPIGQCMYLSPLLEFETQRFVDFIVAHECAHAVLDHHNEPAQEEHSAHPAIHDNKPHEKEATALAASWGFTHPKRYKQRLDAIAKFYAQEFDQ